jgi:hypothetical protein
MIIAVSDSRMIRDVIAAGCRYGTRGGQRCPVIQQLDSHYGLISHYRSVDRSTDRSVSMEVHN